MLSRNMTSAEEMALMQLKMQYTFVDNPSKPKLENIKESQEEESKLGSFQNTQSRLGKDLALLASNSLSKSSFTHSKSALLISISNSTNNRFQASIGTSKISGTGEKFSSSSHKVHELTGGSGEQVRTREPQQYKRTLTHNIKTIHEENEQKRRQSKQRERWWEERGLPMSVKRSSYKHMMSDSQTTGIDSEKHPCESAVETRIATGVEVDGILTRGNHQQQPRANTQSSELINDREEDVEKSIKRVDKYFKGVSDEIDKEKRELERLRERRKQEQQNVQGKDSFLEECILKDRQEEPNFGVESAGNERGKLILEEEAQLPLGLKPEPEKHSEIEDPMAFPTENQTHSKRRAKRLKLESSELLSAQLFKTPGHPVSQSTAKHNSLSTTNQTPTLFEKDVQKMSHEEETSEAKIHLKKDAKIGSDATPLKAKAQRKSKRIQKARKRKKTQLLQMRPPSSRRKKRARESKNDKLRRLEQMKLETPTPPKARGKKGKRFKLKKAYKCNCKGSNCIQAYCKCFKNGSICSSLCQCNNCLNNRNNMDFANIIQKNYASENKGKVFKQRFRMEVKYVTEGGVTKEISPISSVKIRMNSILLWISLARVFLIRFIIQNLVLWQVI